jgi:acetylornithine/succinyldiaminopimelate/putrescine aminotransferase
VAIHEKITPDTVAVIVETIQGEGGVNVAPEGYLKALRELCTEKEILLIIDEVQTGVGRTGKFYSYLEENIIPDIVASAKGLANGLPLGATICSKEVAAEIKPGNHGSTFGGNPVAIAAANAVVDLLTDDKLKEIEQLGNMLLDALHGLNLPEIKNIRGKGLLIGVEFIEGVSAKVIAQNLLEKGFLVATAGDSVLRILPPFVVTQTELMKFLSALRTVVQEISNK